MAKNNTTTANASLKYRTMISKSQEEIKSEDLELTVQQAKSQLEIDIATTKRDLSVSKRKLAETQSRIPYSIQYEINAAKEVKALEEGLAFAEAILAERF